MMFETSIWFLSISFSLKPESLLVYSVILCQSLESIEDIYL